ncbi:NAD-dependent epimerase [Lujinxingia litoralis]|uniref:NAD-dependent epimerase n=1 Tax=Lujinxingia litoralis TaxID=2211119 RepID=A0A328CB23_9DELT|nr:NAD-dependent epimerase/dehydratase family protein [Lujinxingia litoralis]RAL22973.1 NAD-dependent epimerase [Lujinxingia litoralis]
MTTLITGGTGFLGRHLIDQLIARGQTDLRVLTRRHNAELEALGVEQMEGSLTDADDLARAVEGVSHVYHLAGLVERDRTQAHRMYELHVEASRKLFDALVASDTPVQKIVVASTSGTVGVSSDADFVATDASPYAEHTVRDWPYYLSKIYAERVCLEYLQRHDLPIVLMRPTLLLGPGDWRESSTGDVILFMKNKVPGVLPGGISVVDVRDTAEAFITAMERAEPGATYLLGAGNMTLASFFEHLADITGQRSPRLPVPGKLAKLGGKLLDALQDAGAPLGDIDPASLEMARYFWYIDSSRAERELDFSPRPVSLTLRDTVQWIREHHPDFAGQRRPRPEPPANWVPQETRDFARELRRRSGAES